MIKFNLSDPIENYAFRVAQYLAARSVGLRKKLVISLLVAVGRYEEETGQIFDPSLITAERILPRNSSAEAPRPVESPSPSMKAKIQKQSAQPSKMDLLGNFDDEI